MRPTSRLLVVLAALGLDMLLAAPASSQSLRYFYCYAVDRQQGAVFVSDMHDVGPVSERASYGEQFANWLKAKGIASGAVKPFCVMRPTEDEVAQGRRELSAYCPECGGIRRFRDIAWLRQGKDAKALLAGKLTSPRDAPTHPAAKSPKQVVQGPGTASAPEPVDGQGVFILGRRDATDVIYSANEHRGAYLVRQKADLRGGKWTSILSDNRCPGWVAVAYASNGTERWYYVAQGADSEGEAGQSALAAADNAAKRMEGLWITGVLASFRNNFQPQPVDLVDAVIEDGAIDTMKGIVRRQVVSGCPAERSPYATIGIRG
jgi:hypothetical protein